MPIPAFLKRNKVLLISILAILLVLSTGGYFFEKKWDKAEEYYRQGQYDLAAKQIAFFPLPNNLDRLKIYAHIMFAIDELNKAEKAYSLLASKTNSPFFAIMLGNTYKKEGKTQQAIEQYEEVIDAYPNYIQTYLNLASLYNLQGQKEKAVEVLKRGAKSNPNAVNIYEMVVSILINDKDSNDYKWAKNKLSKLDPNNILLKDGKDTQK